MDFFFTLGAFHGLLVLLTLVVVLYSDHQGYLYFKGTKATLSSNFTKWSHRFVWIGLILVIVTGAFLTIPTWEYRFTDSVFYLKMGFVGVLLMNAFAIGTLSKKAETTPFSELTPHDRKTLIVSGALSFISWLGAASIGFFIL